MPDPDFVLFLLGGLLGTGLVLVLGWAIGVPLYRSVLLRRRRRPP